VTSATASAPPIDQTTAATIREALAAARTGRLAEASAIAERGLANGGDPIALNALLGMFRSDLGQPEAAVRSLEIAHAARPKDVRIAGNLANALVRANDLARALEIAKKELAFADPMLELARLRGYIANQLGEYAAAIEALEHVVAQAPEDWQSWNNLGNARGGADDFKGCAEAHGRAVQLNPRSAPSRLNHANALRDLGRIDEAETAYRQMATDFPEDANPFRELHLMFKIRGEDEKALEAVSAAVERDPNSIELLLAKAAHQSALHRMEAAEETYKRVLEIDRANATAYLGLTLVYELSNRGDDLSNLVEDAEKQSVSEKTLRFMRAYHYRRTKEFEKGLAELEQVPDELETTRRLHLLGQLLEGVGKYGEAFAAFERMNELFRDDTTKPEERGARYRHAVRAALEIVTEEWVHSWRSENAPDDRTAPVFLVGFPRSGTTLLDTILMSHPRIEVLEEEPALRRANTVLNDFAGLPTAMDAKIQEARKIYWETSAALAPLAPGNLLIDKNPLTMNLLPLVRRLFPEARVILALRHPCDVLLSCFMANFRLNDGMANFLTLESAADLYDASFSYYEHVQQLMPFPTHVVTYEKLVADRETELRALFDFLGLDWHDAVLDHQETAKKRGRIKTASYAQVIEPIYTRSAGRWEKYRKYLEPVLPVLRPWIEKFGYTA
jgi:tetratricopeptide (TPR) repeat protein